MMLMDQVGGPGPKSTSDHKEGRPVSWLNDMSDKTNHNRHERHYLTAQQHSRKAGRTPLEEPG